MNRSAAITIIDIGYYYEKEIAQLNALGLCAKYLPMEGTSDTQRIIRTLSGFDIVLAGPELWNETTLSGIGSLQMIARLGAGVEMIDLAAATRHGIAVANTPGANACSVAQHALCFMLDLALSMTKYDRGMRSGTATRRRAKDLIGKTIGLVGFGNIPRALAGLLRGFNVEILAFDVYQDEKAAAMLGARFVGLDELIARSDFISLHVPLNDFTKGMADKTFFKSMKRTAYLINTSRGGVVKEDDLIEALQKGEIAGAGLDVYETSPLRADSPLLYMDNVVHTPYVAFSSELGNTRTMEMAIQSVSEFLSGQTISHLLNPDYAKYIHR